MNQGNSEDLCLWHGARLLVTEGFGNDADRQGAYGLLASENVTSGRRAPRCSRGAQRAAPMRSSCSAQWMAAQSGARSLAARHSEGGVQVAGYPAQLYPGGQMLPQPPQLLASVHKCASQPLSGLPSQLPYHLPWPPLQS